MTNPIPYANPSAKSVCTCNHLGDGDRSEHMGYIGHGGCAVRTCDCEKFTWNHYADQIEVAQMIGRMNIGRNWRIRG